MFNWRSPLFRSFRIFRTSYPVINHTVLPFQHFILPASVPRSALGLKSRICSKSAFFRSWAVTSDKLRSVTTTTNESSVSGGSDSGPVSSIDNDEVHRFELQASKWWNQDGPAKILHRLNPLRISYVRAAMENKNVTQWQQQPQESINDNEISNSTTTMPLHGLAVLDIGCGGGLVSEPLSRLGANVLGCDASKEAIAVATAHAETDPWIPQSLRYRNCTAEDLLPDHQEFFDTVLCLEIVEHVSNPEVFLETCCRLVKPGGRLILSTLNRTPMSFLIAILGAEYIMGIVPKSTHEWRKFVLPTEIQQTLENFGMRTTDVTGIQLSPTFSFYFTDDLSVNYIMTCIKDQA